ncbi:hypothetical protein KV112_21600 [Mycolicibacter sp. MYC123]|uniref:Mce protein n=1 Tax=[Mycobacterium] zoologicum TaxID=2872311 RepID=A0ABU5YQE6_9MYCO|nr:hypothetical protein [Mycolicibacter sp. MYC123]MEB3052291.1 hypothetical protein [Mycolicibacter sp. MYC123]
MPIHAPASEVFDEAADDHTHPEPPADPAASREDPSGSPVPEDPAKPRQRVRRILVGSVLVTLAAAVGTAGVLGWQLKREYDTQAAGRAALAVANDYAVALTSIDSAKVDDSYAKVLDGATGGFKDTYSQSAAQLRQLLIDNKAVSHGVVIDSAIRSATRDKVEVLVFVDQSITNAVNPNPRIDRNRVAITMVKIDNRWLASDVDIK